MIRRPMLPATAAFTGCEEKLRVIFEGLTVSPIRKILPLVPIMPVTPVVPVVPVSPRISPLWRTDFFFRTRLLTLDPKVIVSNLVHPLPNSSYPFGESRRRLLPSTMRRRSPEYQPHSQDASPPKPTQNRIHDVQHTFTSTVYGVSYIRSFVRTTNYSCSAAILSIWANALSNSF
jgi:hypothetical protein